MKYAWDFQILNIRFVNLLHEMLLLSVVISQIDYTYDVINLFIYLFITVNGKNPLVYKECGSNNNKNIRSEKTQSASIKN